MAATTLNVMSCHISNPLHILSLRNFFIYFIPRFLLRTSIAFMQYSFAKKSTSIITYLYVLCQYSTYSRRQGGVGSNDQESIYFYAILHRENLKQDYLNSFLPRIYRFFYTLLISNYKFKITTVPKYIYRITS